MSLPTLMKSVFRVKRVRARGVCSLISIRYSSSISTNSGIKEVDIAIVGGGFGGAWAAQRICTDPTLKHLKIAVFERSARIGGRLYSDQNEEYDDAKIGRKMSRIDPDQPIEAKAKLLKEYLASLDEVDEHDEESGPPIKKELGGMRIFPQNMTMVAQLMKDYELDYTSLQLGDEDNIFSYQNERIYKKNAKYPSKENGGGKWADCKIGDMSKCAEANYKSTDDWAELQQLAAVGEDPDPYKSDLLRKLNLRDFFKQFAGANDVEIDTWFAYSGYNLYHNDVTSAIYVKDGEWYGSDLGQQQFVEQGFQTLVEKMMDKAVATNQCTKHLLTRVDDIYKSGDGRIGFTVNHKFLDTQEQWFAKRMILSLTAVQIRQLRGLNRLLSADRWGAIDSCKSVPLFKCFLNWNKYDYSNQTQGKGEENEKPDPRDPWWEQAELLHGKTTVDDHGDEQSADSPRQIHYYGKTDLLLYCSDGDVPHKMFATKNMRTFQREKKSGIGYKTAYDNMYKEVVDVHKQHCDIVGIPIPEPTDYNYKNCCHAYWISGSHKWKTGADVKKCQDLIENNARDDSHIYIMGDAFSSYQGWTEGACETGERVIENITESLNESR